ATRTARNEAMLLNEADYTPTMTALHRIIQQASGDKVDEHQHLKLAQLKTALSKPPLAHQLSRLLIHYESEWYADKSLTKWQALDELWGYHSLKQSYETLSTDNLTVENLVCSLGLPLEEAKALKV